MNVKKDFGYGGAENGYRVIGIMRTWGVYRLSGVRVGKPLDSMDAAMRKIDDLVDPNQDGKARLNAGNSKSKINT